MHLLFVALAIASSLADAVASDVTQPPVVELAKAQSNVECGALSRIKTQMAQRPSEDMSPEDLLWESGDGDFVYFDERAWTVTTCFAGKSVTVQYDAKHEPERFVSVARNAIRVDGQKIFVVFSGFCGEGPCHGSSSFYKTDGAKIVRFASVDADHLEKITEGSATAFVADTFCIRSDSTVEYSYFDYFEVDGTALSLKKVPYGEMRKRYPKTLQRQLAALAEIRKSRRSNNTDRRDKNALAVQGLIDAAYLADSPDALLKAFDKIAKKPKALREVYCSPRHIIKSIASRP